MRGISERKGGVVEKEWRGVKKRERQEMEKERGGRGKEGMENGTMEAGLEEL
jgi:hypothetical protein